MNRYSRLWDPVVALWHEWAHYQIHVRALLQGRGGPLIEASGR
jgi:hypothetical protein